MISQETTPLGDVSITKCIPIRISQGAMIYMKVTIPVKCSFQSFKTLFLALKVANQTMMIMRGFPN